MPKAIKVIPATKDRFTALPTVSIAKRRVAAYARVSTDSDEQFTSYEAQIDYYTQYIKKREDWEFVKVYTDEGISGTNTKRREGFNDMVADALAGKIDLIVTKSVSRFARNTVDSLVTVRKLKEHHVEVFFEKENIYTFDSKGELLITIMSSLAQEESRSISENVTWGQRKRFADGKVSMPYKQFLGYDRGEGGVPVINEKEAEIVRMIYRLFLEGKTASGICKHLMGLGIPTPGGKTKWGQGTVMSILQNEKYKGDALLQKKFTVDFLTKKQKVNEGEVPQYYVEGSHPAIISALDFDRVQAEIARRQSLGRSYSGSSLFASKLICGDCGGFYGKKVWHSTDAYRREVWRCNSKFNGKAKCGTPTLSTESIQQMFLQAYNQLMGNREQVIQACEVMREVVADCSKLDSEIATMNDEIQVIAGLVSQCIKENATTQQSQEEYTEKYNRLVKRYEKAVSQLKKATADRESRMQRDRELRIFIGSIKEKPLVLETWDEGLWITLLETATVHADNRITFRFKDGTDIEVGAE
jgi:DNA invertase Pin-like site-specific DNA recombinase